MKYNDSIKKSSNKKIKKNFICNHIYQEYHVYMTRLAKIVIMKYYAIPLDWNDLYIIGMNALPDIIREFESQDKFSKLQVYIATRVVGLMRIYCRKWLKKKHLFFNLSSSFNDEFQKLNKDYSENNIYPYSNDSYEEIARKINLNKFDLQIFLLYFEEDKNVSQICQKLNLTRYEVSKSLQHIKLKFSKKYFK